MRIFKTVMLLATVALATQGHSFDLTHMAIKAVSRYVPQAEQPYRSTKHAGAPVDVSLPQATGNFGNCRENFANGEPPRISNDAELAARALCFNGFAVLHSGKTKTPIYSAEVLNRARIEAAKGEQRTNVFFADARLPQKERSTLEDFRGSTFDRGHNSPAGDMNNEQAMAQSFSLANMIPQAPENNRKAWADIEKATRGYVKRAKGNVYVVTGPVFDRQSCSFVLAAKKALASNNLPIPESNKQVLSEAVQKAGFHAPHRYDPVACTIGAGNVSVPSHIFKLVYDPSTNRAWAHWLENTDWARVSAPIRYEELVRRTGIDFLPGISPKG